VPFTAEHQDFLQGLGRRIKLLRKSRNLTQAQLATDLNVEISQISRIERGIINTSVLSLKSIADVMQVEINAFFMEE
jgi:transcriptional regulator with XRE-family HTH domain